MKIRWWVLSKGWRKAGFLWVWE